MNRTCLFGRPRGAFANTRELYENFGERVQYLGLVLQDDGSDGLPRRYDVTATTTGLDDEFAIDVF